VEINFIKKLLDMLLMSNWYNLWQRIKNELQGWSNKDANDSSYDDTQV
jgi:hypothetical protein